MATWYAQLVNKDIKYANQWNAAPDGSGAWLTWENLQPTDVLCANGKASLYVSSGFTCGSITTSGGGIGADGGRFDVQTGAKAFTLTCDVVAGTTTCLLTGHTAGTVEIRGNVTGGSVANQYGIFIYSGAGVVAVTGNVTAATAAGVQSQAAGGTIIVNGNVTASTVPGVANTGAGRTIVVNGNVTAATVAGVTNTGAGGTITVTGSLISSSVFPVQGTLYWQPASVAHYWQVAWNGSLDQRYTEAPGEESVRYGLPFGYNGVTLMTGSMVVPAVTDVRAGVGYDDEAKTLGTLALPAEADVKAGVGYGGAGTEYTGTLVAGGGGVPLIGPGGLVG